MKYKYTIYTGDYYNLKLKENSLGTIHDLKKLLPEDLFDFFKLHHLLGTQIKLEMWIDYDLYKIETLEQ